MNKHLDPQIEAVEQPPTPVQPLTSPPLDNGNAVISASENYADIDWEIEIIAQRRGDGDKGTKTDGSQGCH